MNRKNNTMDEEMHRILTETFAPTHLDIRNDSHLHAGHVGDDGSGETHYHVVITSRILEKQSRVERQRAIMKALKPCYDKGLHALSVTTQ